MGSPGGARRAKRNIENENKENYELCQARTEQARSDQASFAKPLLKVIGIECALSKIGAGCSQNINQIGNKTQRIFAKYTANYIYKL